MTECCPSPLCYSDLCYDPYTRCYRVSDGLCPPRYNYHSTLQACIPAGGVYCSKPRCSCRPSLPCPGTKSCGDLLESVAEAQRALSHILSAESVKLERVIASTSDFDALLEINREVNRTLVDVTFLEQALFHELEQIQELCGACGLGSECPCCPCEPEP